jgi:hypothetical protein
MEQRPLILENFNWINMSKFQVFWILASSIFLNACGGGSIDPQSESSLFYKYAGSLQCLGGGLSLSEMTFQISNSGILVLEFYCGDDGLPHIAMCGATDGRIGIFKVHLFQEQTAFANGLKPLSTLPSAVKTDC